MVTEGDLTWGSEHTIQCTDGLLWNYVPETCVILLTCVTSKNSIKSKKKKKFGFYNKCGYKPRLFSVKEYCG